MDLGSPTNSDSHCVMVFIAFWEGDLGCAASRYSSVRLPSRRILTSSRSVSTPSASAPRAEESSGCFAAVEGCSFAVSSATGEPPRPRGPPVPGLLPSPPRVLGRLAFGVPARLPARLDVPRLDVPPV